MVETDPQGPVKFLAWDSQFFDRRIGRVLSRVLTQALVQQINAFALQNKLDCLYFLADSADTATTLLAEEDGYHWVDIRMTLRRKLDLPPKRISDAAIRLVTEKDIPYLTQIAHSAYTDSRFYADSHFERARCSQLYEIWIQKSCLDREGCVWVYEDQQLPVGYVTGRMIDHQTGCIDLVGIHPDWRWKGIAQKLIARTLEWFQDRSIQSVTVVTQGKNIPAQVVYQKCGFHTDSVELWFHKWF